MTLAIILLLGQPSFALFDNGGFESGDFTGWDLDFGYRTGSSIIWGQSDHGLYDVIDSSGTMYGQSLDVNPYNGSYMARINDINGSNHATMLSQYDTLEQADIDAGSTLYVNWGAMLIEPSNEHPQNAQPFFGITVYVNGGVAQAFSADATAHSSDPTWIVAGDDGISPLYYKNGTWNFDLSSYSVGDTIGVELYVADCDWGGHGGYAFLDGIGTTYQPPSNGGNPVPEPATMLLLGPALLGLIGLKKKRA